MRSAILSNLGFLMQMSGIFMIFPVILSFIFNETSGALALFLAAIIFLGFGFLLNAFCERRELTYKQSCVLFVLVFILLSLIGALPYIFINISKGDIAQNITNGIFESMSGFTATGFSVIPNLSAVPKSIIFYRALTQFTGGIGIVLILLAFFYPEAKLQDFSRGIGFGKNQKIKKTFFLILLVYLICFIVLTAIGLIFGYRDIITLVSFIFSALGTGGFHPVNDITMLATQFPLNIILIAGMIIGASNFIIMAGLFKRRFKEFLKSEVPVFLIMAIISITIVTIFFPISLFDSTFHVISAMSTTGFSYLNIQPFDNLKLFLAFLMFVGGTSFSTAGGIKIYRFLLLFKAAKKTVVDSITKQDTKVKLFGKEYTNTEIIQSVIVVILMASVIFVSAAIVSSYGYSVIDSIFETTSAVATTGLSVGIAGPSLVLELKWLFIFIMLLGRVEILAFLVMFSRKKEPKTT